MAETYQRSGPESKCPACGWRLDPDAYRCPKCLIYFCHKCRKRVQKNDAQFQCANQTCGCHGKLVCAACTVMVPEFGDVFHTTVVAGKVTPARSGTWEAIKLIALICAVIVWLSISPSSGPISPLGFIINLCLGLITGVVILATGAFISIQCGRPLKDVPVVKAEDRMITTSERGQIGDHRSCIQCRKPVEVLGQ